jgi:Acetyltransferase (GNAT) domain
LTIAVRYATAGDYARISAFLDTYWAKGHVYTRQPRLFDWTFGRRNLWDQDSYSFALAEDESELVGILGGIPFVFNCLGHESPAIWFANYMVRPDHRRGSLALRLLNMFRRPPYTTVVAFGVNPAAIPFYQALRARVPPEIPRHFGVLPGAEERLIRLLCVLYPDWPASRARTLARALRLPNECGETAPANRDSAVFAHWDEQDWPYWAGRTVGAARSRDYIQWRYSDHPCFTYQVTAIPEGERTGLLIWRLETMRRSTPHGFEDIDRVGRLVEFLPTSRHNAQALLAHFCRMLHEAGAIGADYYGYHGETGNWLQELGFRMLQGNEDGLAIPARFQPLDGKGTRILSAVFAADNVPVCSSDPSCLWYWTKSDADQDRPN